MKSLWTLFVGYLCAAMAAALGAEERTPPPRPSSAHAEAFTDAERRAVVEWTLAQPEVKNAVAGRRTRVLRVWSDVSKANGGSRRRAVVLLRDYDAGIAREVAVDLSTGSIDTRELPGIQPNAEEIEEGMSIIRRDPGLAALVADSKLELIGGFHTVSRISDDPCAREICLDFAFMRPNYEGPARYVIVNLSRGRVANRDFRPRPGKGLPRMTKKTSR
jgi:hypothetical protein